jgi:zinc transport system permease protein
VTADLGADAPTWQSFLAGWEIFRDPILCALFAGAVLGYLGVHIVVRRLVFVSAGVTQAAGFGVALVFFVQILLDTHIEPLLGAAVLALGATLLLATDTRRLGVPRETFLGFVFALAGGGAIILGDKIMQEAHDIEAILFGSAVLVRPVDLAAVLTIGTLVTAALLATQRAVLFAGVDADAARVQGLPVRRLNALLFVSVGLMAGVSARALGSLPVFAFSTLPAAAALATGISLGPAFVLAAALGALAGALGYVTAFFLELPVGGCQTTIAALVFLLALAGGKIARARRR